MKRKYILYNCMFICMCWIRRHTWAHYFFLFFYPPSRWLPLFSTSIFRCARCQTFGSTIASSLWNTFRPSPLPFIIPGISVPSFISLSSEFVFFLFDDSLLISNSSVLIVESQSDYRRIVLSKLAYYFPLVYRNLSSSSTLSCQLLFS